MWDRTGQIIRGVYCGVPYHGAIGGSRVKFGGEIQHTVDLFDDVEIFDDVRSSILILESDEFGVDCEDYRLYCI